MKQVLIVSFLYGVLGLTTLVQAMDDAVVLPKGVRRVMLNTVYTKFHEQTNGQGENVPLAAKLERDVTYDDFIKVRKGSDRVQLQGFLQSQGIDQGKAVGSISADLRGQVNVFVPSFAFGITDRFSLGLVVPIYRAKTDVAVGFNPNKEADHFLGLLADPEVGQANRAAEAADALNGVVGTLNQKLEDNGYERLGYWEETGIGDIFVKGKYQFVNVGMLRAASTFVITAPTGRVDDPDILTDLGFGDGTWDLLAGVGFDQLIGGPFFINEYFMYTAQLPASREIRMKTENEAIEVDKKRVHYDLGDKIDTGLSMQFDATNGLLGGLGYSYQHKFKDQYSAGASSSSYEDGTEQSAHLMDALFGYSSVHAYRRNAAAVPYAANVSYLHQLQTRNLPVADRWQLEMKVFF